MRREETNDHRLSGGQQDEDTEADQRNDEVTTDGVQNPERQEKSIEMKGYRTLRLLEVSDGDYKNRYRFLDIY